MAIYDENAAYCRRCGEYHYAKGDEDPLQLVDDCEAGNW